MRKFFCLIGLFLCFPAFAANDLNLRLHYKVYAGGIRAAEATVTILKQGDHYDIVTDAKTAGLLAMVAKWTTRVESHGRVTGAELYPDWHQSKTDDRGKIKGMRLDFDKDGAIAVSFDPPLNDPIPPDEQVSAEALKGASDGLTVIMQTLFSTEASGCKGRHAIFDGRRRFDLVMRDIGPETVPESKYNLFSGTADTCKLGFIPIAGFSDKTRRNQFWSRYGDPEGLKPLPVWLARFDGIAIALPVRMKMETRIGIVMAHLDSVESLDTGLHLVANP